MNYRQHIIKFYCFCAFLTSFHLLSGQSADITESCPDVEIDFAGPDGLSEYFWDFKDGGFSDTQNPSHLFLNPGVFDVDLLEGENGDLIGTVQITIYNFPVLFAEVDEELSSFCKGSEVVFRNTSMLNEGVGIVNYTWTFGDNDFFKGLTDPAHIYSTEGTYSIGLALDSDINGCDITKANILSVTINGVTAAFDTDPELPSACEPPLEVSFMNNSDGEDLSYSWSFGNGMSSTAQNPLPVNYTEPGSYQVKLVVSGEGCLDSTTQDVFIGEPMASFSLGDTVCTNSEITVQNDSDFGEYIWDFDGATVISEDGNPIVVFTESREYTIQLILTVPGGCVDTIEKMVFAQELEASFTRMPSYSCFQTLEITYSSTVSDNVDEIIWVFCDENGEIIDSTTGPNPTHVFNAAELSEYQKNDAVIFQTKMFAITESGCTTIVQSMDTIHQPDARFMPDVIQGCLPLMVTFSDSSMSNEGIVEWIWTFGDETSIMADSDEDQMHTYTEAGVYDVTLEIVNDEGCRDTSYVIQISVGEITSLDFTFDPIEICVGDTFSIDYEGLQEWSYSTEGGPFDQCVIDSSTDVVWNHIPGIYDLNISVIENGCSSDTVIENVITVNGVFADPYFEINCSDPLNVFIADSTGGSETRIWTLNDDTISMEQSFVHNFGETGDYEVILIVDDPAGLCDPNSDTLSICVRDVQSVITLDKIQCLKIPPTLVSGDSQDAYNTCWRGYKWFLPDSRPITTDLDTIMDYTWPDTGRFTATLVVNDINGCYDTSEMQVIVYDITADFVVDPEIFCVPESVTLTDLSTSDTTIISWMWDANGNMSEEQNTVVEITQNADELEVSLTVENDAMCTDTKVETYPIYQPQSNITVDPGTVICPGDEITFTASDYTEQGSNLEFMWDFDNGDMGTLQTETTTYPEAGVYFVTLNFQEVSSGCSGSAEIQIQVVDPNAEFTVPDTLCEDSQIAIASLSPEATNLWFLNTNPPVTSPNYINTLSPGVYDLTHIVSFGSCSDTFTVNFEVFSSPSATIEISPMEACPGDPITFSLGNQENVASWTWDFGSGQTFDNIDPVVLVFDTVMNIPFVNVLLFNENGCRTSNTQTVDVLSIGGIPTLPFAFSPNNDGLNDRYVPFIFEEELPMGTIIDEFQVINRWGQVVYDNEDGIDGWDGTQDNEPAAEDVYYAILKMSIPGCAIAVDIKQDVTLVR